MTPPADRPTCAGCLFSAPVILRLDVPRQAAPYLRCHHREVDVVPYDTCYEHTPRTPTRAEREETTDDE